MLICYWSSAVCSSDLATVGRRRLHAAGLILPPRLEIAAGFARIVVARRTFVIDPVLMRGLRIDREQRRVRAQDVLITAAVPRLAIKHQHLEIGRAHV